jgi:DNA-binding MarR family transcriptional regulator
MRRAGRRPKPIETFDDVELNHGLAIRLAGRAFTRVLQSALEGFDINAGEFRIVRTIGSYPGRTQNELADLAGFDRPYVATIIKRLRSRKLVTTVPDRHDRRRANVALTARGRRLREAVLVRIAPTIAIAETGLTKGDLALFHRVIRTMVASIERHYGTEPLNDE